MRTPRENPKIRALLVLRYWSISSHGTFLDAKNYGPVFKSTKRTESEPKTQIVAI